MRAVAIGSRFVLDPVRFADLTEGEGTVSVASVDQSAILAPLRRRVVLVLFLTGRRACMRAALEGCPSSPLDGSWSQEHKTCARGKQGDIEDDAAG